MQIAHNMVFSSIVVRCRVGKLLHQMPNGESNVRACASQQVNQLPDNLAVGMLQSRYVQEGVIITTKRMVRIHDCGYRAAV